MTRRVYLDHNASTPVHPEVLAEMLPYFSEVYGNPSSIHAFGRAAREGVDLARERVAQFLGVAPTEGVFTSGGTESDNFGIKGLAFARGRGHLITSKIEHHAVLRTCQALEGMGFEVTYVGVDGHGMVDPDEVRRAIRPDTIAVSIMHANSEVGTLQPIEAIGRATRERGIPLHVDAVQTFGKVPFDVHALGIDALSFSAHKIYGPKGIAGLYVRKGTRMVSIQHGGEHERRRRPSAWARPARGCGRGSARASPRCACRATRSCACRAPRASCSGTSSRSRSCWASISRGSASRRGPRGRRG